MEKQMKRIALVGIMLKDPDEAAELNSILHEYSGYIIGRMGIPRAGEDGVLNVISVALEAPQDVISSLSGRIGRLSGVTARTIYSDRSKLPESAWTGGGS